MTNSARLASFLGSFPHGQLTVSIGGYTPAVVIDGYKKYIYMEKPRVNGEQWCTMDQWLQVLCVMRRSEETEQKKWSTMQDYSNIEDTS